VIAGHLDTVPVAGNLPSHWETVDGEERLYGRGACDMKAGVAVMLHLATRLTAPNRPVTWVFYDHEEVAAEVNGLGRLSRVRPDLLRAELAILMEPTAAQVEGGCQGTMRFQVTTRGVASHSARSWLGRNAVHEAADVLERCRAFGIRDVVVDGLTYREQLNATEIAGGIAGNVVPDRCATRINYRFAPDKTTQQAEAEMRELFGEWEVEVLDLSPGARPGLDKPAAQQFVAATGGAAVGPKYGWTDVARFAALGVPALNYGPGDAGKAHADDEFAPYWQLESCAGALARWLGGKE
jgi:succinyl-diaminopimelate desuccinylase